MWRCSSTTCQWTRPEYATVVIQAQLGDLVKMVKHTHCQWTHTHTHTHITSHYIGVSVLSCQFAVSFCVCKTISGIELRGPPLCHNGR